MADQTQTIQNPAVDEIQEKYYHRLAGATFLKAVCDAAGLGQVTRADREEAEEWLLSESGRFFCELIGFDHQVVSSWVQAGCPSDQVRLVDKRFGLAPQASFRNGN